MTKSNNTGQGLSTRLINTGRDPSRQNGAVNPPTHRASTIVLETAEELYSAPRTYGIRGGQVHDELKAALCALEKAKHCILTESGLLACTLPIFTFVGAGDHLLVPDNSYGPTRRYCDRSLQRTGGSVTYYDSDIGAGIADLIQDNTKLLIIETPGSLTFEVPDTKALIAVAQARGVKTVLDNCWGSGVYLNPLEMGVDMSVLATTKYAAGHSDSLSGAILTKDRAIATALENASSDLGLCLSPEDASIVLRGLRTMAVRLKRHEASGLEIAKWLSQHPNVDRVLHPGLPDDRYHALWQRDFTGSAGLFSFVLKSGDIKTANAFLNALSLFGLGFSYGGYESLAIVCDPQMQRTVKETDFAGPVIRLAIGLEDPEDLIADLENGFAAIRSSST